MPERPASLARIRDALLVVGMATAAFVLGATAVGPGDQLLRPDSVAAAHPAVAGHVTAESSADPAPRALRPSGPAAPNIVHPALDRPRLAPEPIGWEVMDGRFFGEAGGRGDPVAALDPYDGRVYILTTAWQHHRRGWIGLEDRVADAAAGSIDNPVRPAARGGPR